MKSINNFILEKLKLNSQSKLKGWSIEDAKEGDIITAIRYFEETKYTWKATFIFNNIYEGIIGRKKVNFHCYYIWPENMFYCHDKYEKGSIGNVEDFLNGIYKYGLASESEKRKLFEEIKKAGYTWDPIKKELKKI